MKKRPKSISSIINRFINPINFRKVLIPRKAPKNLWKLIGRYALYAGIGLVFLVAFAFAWYAKDLPTPEKIAKRSATQSTKIFDRTGNTLLYETGEQKRTIISYDQMSDYLRQATVAVEDEGFYSHMGFDPRAIFAAVVERITHRSSRTRGASTITQQYVKNALLDSNRTMARKIKELILAIELEVMYDKKEILTMYLNEIPYGGNIAGAEAASQTYYGKPAKDLTIAQAATLASIPQSPTYYYPYGTHTKELVYRRDYVIDRMRASGYINQEQADAAKTEDTTTIGEVVKPRKDSILSPHFAMYVIEQAEKEFGEEKIQKEGYKIITTLDLDKQNFASEALAYGSKKIGQYGASNAAIVSVDPNTGEILAMVGSLDYFNTEIDGNVNVADSDRQPGSSFKPFAYATLLKDKNYSPSKIIWDLQTDFGGGYVPRNYNGNFNGPVTIRTALSNSLNIPAVKALSLAGIDNVLQTARDMGISTLNERDRYGLSLVLGAGEVKPVEMAGAFGTFATGGIKHDLKCILKVTDARGKIAYEYKSEDDKGRQVIDNQVAYEISSILSDNKARSMVFGANSALNFPGKTIAAKTGTTSSFKDAWTVGYSKNLATAVWVGNNDSKAMKNGADGSVLAGPIFHHFMNNAVTENIPFDRPSEIQELTVEKYSNKLPGDLSSEFTTDIFANWQVPTDQDNVHVKARVCRSNGLLAAENVSSDLTEDKIFTNIHSERPDNPNWEGPVRAWLSSRGWNDLAPTDKCDPVSTPITLSFISPVEGQSVSGTKTIKVNVSSTYTVKKVTYYIDNIFIALVDSAPFETTYSFDGLSNASHTIKAVAEDSNGASGEKSISVIVSKDKDAIKFSEITATKLTATTYKISWKTDKASMSQVIYGTVSQSDDLLDYQKTSDVDTNLVTNHSVTITVTAGQKYYYRVVSSDNEGNTAVSTPENSFNS